MSRSAHSRRAQLKDPPSHKKLRTAVNRELSGEVARLKSARQSVWLEVLADELEELGELEKAEVLRSELDLVLPVAPHGWNTRLRW